MGYISTTEAAEKWNISQRRVIRLAGEGRIAGAARFGNSWMIPEEAEKPADGRSKAAAPKKEDIFRFPLYVNDSEESFVPPLSEEEKALRRGQLQFLACDFEPAQKCMRHLMKTAESRYVKISAIFNLAFMSVAIDNGKDADRYISLLNLELAEDFDRKKEMQLHLPWYYACLAQTQSAAACFSVDPTYDYSPTVYPLLTYLSFLGKTTDSGDPLCSRMELYEVVVQQLEHAGRFYEAIKIHLALFTIYYVVTNKIPAQTHLQKAVRIAFDRHFIYPIADWSAYYREPFEEALQGYPEEFAREVFAIGERIDRSYSAYMEKFRGRAMWTTLSTGDWRFVLYAFRGYSHKQVATLTDLSERTVANRYAEIYDKLGVDSKQKLVELFTGSLSE